MGYAFNKLIKDVSQREFYFVVFLTTIWTKIVVWSKRRSTVGANGEFVVMIRHLLVRLATTKIEKEVAEKTQPPLSSKIYKNLIVEQTFVVSFRAFQNRIKKGVLIFSNFGANFMLQFGHQFRIVEQ